MAGRRAATPTVAAGPRSRSAPRRSAAGRSTWHRRVPQRRRARTDRRRRSTARPGRSASRARREPAHDVRRLDRLGEVLPGAPPAGRTSGWLGTTRSSRRTGPPCTVTPLVADHEDGSEIRPDAPISRQRPNDERPTMPIRSTTDERRADATDDRGSTLRPGATPAATGRARDRRTASASTCRPAGRRPRPATAIAQAGPRPSASERRPAAPVPASRRRGRPGSASTASSAISTDPRPLDGMSRASTTGCTPWRTSRHRAA